MPKRAINLEPNKILFNLKYEFKGCILERNRQIPQGN